MTVFCEFVVDTGTHVCVPFFVLVDVLSGSRGFACFLIETRFLMVFDGFPSGFPLKHRQR